MVQDLRGAPGIKATIIVANKTLNEYNDEDTTPQTLMASGTPENTAYCTTSVYVQAQSKSVYKIVLEVNENWRSKEAAKLKFVLRVDGQLIAEVFCERPDWVKNNKYGREKFWTHTFEGAESYERNKKYTEPMSFKDLTITDKTSALTPSNIEKRNKARDLGKIELTVYRHMSSKVKAAKKGPNFKAVMTKVPEDLIKGKAKSHTTGFGEEKQARRNGVRMFHEKYLDGPDQPLAIYQWRYLSKDTLQKLRIIPSSRPTSPEPNSEDDEVPDMGPEDRERVKRLEDYIKTKEQELRNLQAGKKRKRVIIKQEAREKGRAETLAAKRAKKDYENEHGPMPKVIIDLGDDDDREESMDLQDDEPSLAGSSRPQSELL